jgi:probable F420-dependent oxidoreductase
VQLGRIGIWQRRQDVNAEAAREIEALGYSALWLGSNPSVTDARPFLEQTSTLVVATSILNIWQHEPADVAAQHAELTSAFPDRFLLGIGVGHPEAISAYEKPLARMSAFFDGLDAVQRPVPRDQRVAAALGPKMLDLAAERSLGAIPYFVTPEHTRIARERMGTGALLAPEVAVVVEPDPETARAKARKYAALYLGATNYLRNLERLGFSERDIADGGSDALIDAVIPHGSPEAIAEAVEAQFDAGADHVCLQPVGHDHPPLDDYRSLAGALVGMTGDRRAP